MNCFQNCIFTYDSQHIAVDNDEAGRCELLSELYFYLWFPTQTHALVFPPLLWIAFRIVFLLMIPNNIVLSETPESVVNCFQNCIFTYDSQQQNFELFWGNCCELLSELYFYLWFPTNQLNNINSERCELLSELYFYLWFPTKRMGSAYFF